MTLEFHPAVQRDFNEALAYYEDAAGPHLAARFEAEFRVCLALIRSAPRQFPFYQGNGLFRRIRLENFPYVIVYREKPGAVRVTLLRHDRRHPRFGSGRR
jgi:plasmid stabilization system protein ParE